ncbi:dTDP-4-dehydrorhamnose reductase [Methylophilaceae bacterium]|nr:dTDP-4-dehydrorhamnose reductase [Methylophilaceae bacterium]
MKILITGSTGQVGHALIKNLTSHQIVALTRKDCNLNKPDEIKRIIDQHLPDLIINSAAYTNVDQAEIDTQQAYRINCDAPKVMAQKAYECDIPLIHFSTDYVFNGEKDCSYEEDDVTQPLGVYGKSKLAGENAIKEIDGQFYIFRTSWVYSNIGNNFFLTMKKLSEEKDELKIVSNQYGVPTSNYFIARQLNKIIPLIDKDNMGIYHLVPDGSCSWYEFAKKIIEKSNPNSNLIKISPIDSNKYKIKTKRPQNSILSNQKVKQVFMLKFKDWKTELEQLIYET